MLNWFLLPIFISVVPIFKLSADITGGVGEVLLPSLELRIQYIYNLFFFKFEIQTVICTEIAGKTQTSCYGPSLLISLRAGLWVVVCDDCFVVYLCKSTKCFFFRRKTRHFTFFFFLFDYVIAQQLLPGFIYLSTHVFRFCLTIRGENSS